MKKIFFALTFIGIISTLQAQSDKDSAGKLKWFDKENLFTGGSVGLGFGSGSTAIGLSPHFGYSINKWLDVAVSFNYNYNSERDYPYIDDKLRQSTYGPGAFVRVFPFNFLYAQAQYEHNFTKLKYIPAGTTTGVSASTDKIDANSLLLGVGYSSGKSADNNTYYYISVMFDVLQVYGSPYLDSRGRIEPTLKAGFNIGLFQGRRRDY